MHGEDSRRSRGSLTSRRRLTANSDEQPQSRRNCDQRGGVDRPASGLAKPITSPTSGSIQQQLLQLHMTNRDFSLDALLPRVMIQRHVKDLDAAAKILQRCNQRLRWFQLMKFGVTIRNTDLALK